MEIAVTCGDPAGIGPEVVSKALASGRLPEARWVVVGPPGAVEPIPGVAFETRGESCREPSEKSGRSALAAIDGAIELVESGRCRAMVTAPVSKSMISRTGAAFLGHTEYLAARSGVRETTMAFVSERLKVALVTTHVPLKRVPARLSSEGVLRAARHLSAALKKYFHVASPRLAVAALNPHAGEDGLLGREEKEVIAPAVDRARREGIDCEGPFAADSIFRRAGYDGFLSMYHDHGLAVVKTVAPAASNVTLGLPYVRTSPDHGTGFDIAGRGLADPEPMIQAMSLACRMVQAEGRLL
jgi:4-hydroxythreonine-4-phosphate dehydrogenase